ncbi:hypothetical protein BGZ76_004171, partial [Entomortierella beljakovae]
MASIPNSSVSDTKAMLADSHHTSIRNIDQHVKLAPGPSAFQPPISPTAPISSHSERFRDNDEDALVPSLSSSFKSSSPPKPYWDDSFYNSTPTPRPPPRLAPMPKSPKSPPSTARSPPPPLVISTQRGNNTPSTPILDPGDPLELGNSKAKSRYANAFAAHNRSFSYNHAHSNHNNNVFATPSDSIGHSTAIGGSISTTGTEGAGLCSTGTNSDPNLNENTTTATAAPTASRGYPSSLLSNASPAAVRSFFVHNNINSNNSSNSYNGINPRHPQTPNQGSPQLHRHPNNPSLTPSSSQSNLFSNLPSPMPRTNINSTTSIFRDAAPPVSNHSRLSSWVSSQTVDQDISDSLIVQQDQSTEDAVSVVTSSSVDIGVGLPSSGQQRKIYPGLKNTVGPYKLIRNIGHGSFSEVKMAVDTRTGDHVAIKVMNRAMIQSSDRLGISVRRESDLLKAVQHPNIIGFREVVETSLQMCIVLDYASGGELFDFVADKRALASEQDIQFIFAQIVDAVDYLHQNNIVHRDLKLE